MSNRIIIKILRVSLVLLALLGISFSIAVLLDYNRVVNYYHDLFHYDSMVTLIAVGCVLRIIYVSFLTYVLITKKTRMSRETEVLLYTGGMAPIQMTISEWYCIYQFKLFIPKLIIEILFLILLLAYLIKIKKKEEDEYE